MADECTDWLERKQRLCRTVTIKVRYADFTTITRSRTFPTPTRDGEIIRDSAINLLAKTAAGAMPVRLLGVSVHNLLTDEEAANGWLPFEGAP
jgi:DNA polymerase-4